MIILSVYLAKQPAPVQFHAVDMRVDDNGWLVIEETDYTYLYPPQMVREVVISKRSQPALEGRS
jgi:hypothetical protein